MANDSLIRQLKHLTGDGLSNAPETSALSVVILPQAAQGNGAPASAGNGAVDGPFPPLMDKDERGGLSQEMARLTLAISGLGELAARQASSLDENTKATQDDTEQRLRDGLSAARRILEGSGGGSLAGFGLSPIASGLLRLFSRDEKKQEPALSQYAAPQPVRLDLALPHPGETGFTTADSGSGSVPRRVPNSLAGNVTVNVQAMDSRSFLDHREEIARAVQQAMLNMHSLNDVVGDL